MKFQHDMIPASDQAHRSASALNSGVVDFAYDGFILGKVIVENNLNQDVSVQLQGRAHGGSIWQNIGSASTISASGGAGDIDVSEPWPELRITCTPGGLPSSGTLKAWFVAV